MYIKHLYCIAILLVTTLLTGCNSDVFLDEPDLPFNTELTIEGDGGVAVCRIPVKALQHITLNMFASRNDATYYNSKGDVIDSDSPASDVSLIVCENSLRRFEIRKDGSQLVITSISNTSKYESHDEIVLEYTFGCRCISLTILPGEQMRLESVDYNASPAINDDAMTKIYRVGFENHSNMELTTTEYPYINRYPYVMVEPMVDFTDTWVKELSLTMAVPVYVDGSWVMVERSGIRPGHEYTYPGPDYMTSVDVTVPANTIGYIITEVKYASAEVSGTMNFINDTLGHRVPVNFNMYSYYPVSYEIRIEKAD